ncbi:glycosyltransferase family 4 protein [Halomarina oriensis]|uniref:Glycosyltransferase n=1 Tax=Halomarina oriensis TaxID=671145 RepID=A0A6B0GNF6_9EURY|nr:glycosyltransferase family 4 protein [Halomarina oriensis]MWG36324.1 glycosyltransferase [Halomarina oriensis]
MSYRLLASAVNHPDAVDPYVSLFNHRMLESLARSGVSLDAVVARPFAPPVGPYSDYWHLPTSTRWGSYSVHHPRFTYLLPKRLFYAHAGDSFAARVPRYVERTFDVPDVVHACDIYPDGYGMLRYCQRHDVPLFAVSHGVLLNTFAEASEGVQERIRETLDGCTELLCVSEALARRAERIAPGVETTVTALGADPEKFPVGNDDAIRREFGIPREKAVVLYVGHFTERKGLGELLETLSSMDPERVEFLFVGHGGELRWDLQRAVAEHGFANHHVYWRLDPIAVRRLFAIADLLVLPSYAEGRPTAIYEAMASDTAVLASTVGGIPEQVVDGETGRLVPPRDQAALEAVLTDMVGDRTLLAEMGRAGRRRLVEQGWTWQAHAERLRARHEAAVR